MTILLSLASHERTLSLCLRLSSLLMTMLSDFEVQKGEYRIVSCNGLGSCLSTADSGILSVALELILSPTVSTQVHLNRMCTRTCSRSAHQAPTIC